MFKKFAEGFAFGCGEATVFGLIIYALGKLGVKMLTEEMNSSADENESEEDSE